jgi:5-methylcytosine-specific restriction endonuclease McrA
MSGFSDPISLIHNEIQQMFPKTKKSERSGNEREYEVSLQPTCYQKGMTVPFTPQQFTAWFLQQFEGTENGVARCPYCNAPIDAYNCVLDHVVPLKREGSPDLSNLAPCCEACNDRKGGLNAIEFA